MTDLYVFAISHYCEKSRWTLDHLGIEHAVRYLAPGAHSQFAKEIGAKGSSLPILVSEGQVIQGSDAIFDWACATSNHKDRTLSVSSNHESSAREIEARLDEIAGVQSRRYFYSEALVEHPESVLPIFSKDLDPDGQKSLAGIWEIVRTVMIDGMDLGREQWSDARDKIETELDWLDGLLADGRRFLVGDQFSRVDITAASLLAVFALPPEHPTYTQVAVPPRSAADIARWKERPSLRWVREIYESHR
ncbi:MAG: glutathione S-transferase family protein [Myxococcota bacterium]